MNIFSAIFGFFGGGSRAAEKVLDIADKATFTQQERATQDGKDTEILHESEYSNGASPFNNIVDGLNRLQRPAWGIYFMLVAFGKCDVPNLSDVDPMWTTLFIMYFTFLFGGRALVQDLPNALIKIRELMRR